MSRRWWWWAWGPSDAKAFFLSFSLPSFQWSGKVVNDCEFGHSFGLVLPFIGLWAVLPVRCGELTAEILDHRKCRLCVMNVVAVVEAEQPPAGRAAVFRFSSWAYVSYVLCLCICSNIILLLSLAVTSGQSWTRVHFIFESHVFTFKNLFNITNLPFKVG